jgi:hypothetical protein
MDSYIFLKETAKMKVAAFLFYMVVTLSLNAVACPIRMVRYANGRTQFGGGYSMDDYLRERHAVIESITLQQGDEAA